MGFNSPDFECTDVAHYAVTTLATWVALTPASFVSAKTGAVIEARNYFSHLVVSNTSGAGTVYLALRTLTIEAPTDAIPIAAGSAVTLPIWGAGLQSISLIGSTEGLTATVLAFFFPTR